MIFLGLGNPSPSDTVTAGQGLPSSPQGLQAGSGGASADLQARLQACNDSDWKLRQASRP